jgi:hypothetical protein
MSEAALILRRFRGRLKQIHMSEVDSRSRHEGISFTALNSFRKVAHLIPPDVPVILETPVVPDQIETQLHLAGKALIPSDQDTPPARTLDMPAQASCLSTPGDAVTT